MKNIIFNNLVKDFYESFFKIVFVIIVLGMGVDLCYVL